MLTTEFMEPMNIEIGELADTMAVHRNTLNRIVHDRGVLNAPWQLSWQHIGTSFALDTAIVIYRIFWAALDT